MKRLVCGAFAVLAAACAPIEGPTASSPPSPSAWKRAHVRWEAVRRALPAERRTFRVRFALTEPFSGRRTEARGAVAMAPDLDALRLLLVGPGGTTAFDLWIAADKFRMAIPALDIVRRGDRNTKPSEMRGMPVGFLRFWLLHPADGALLWFAEEGDRERLWLRNGSAIAALSIAPDGHVTAIRDTWITGPSGRERLDRETIEASRLGCGKATYVQASTGLKIEIDCEAEEPEPPSPRAFVDPDDEEDDEAEGSP